MIIIFIKTCYLYLLNNVTQSIRERARDLNS